MSFFDEQPQRPGADPWNVFAAPEVAATIKEQREQARAERRARLSATAAVFAPPHARAWLESRAAAEQAVPSYQPGAPFDLVAWREGRKALLRELLNELDEATRPSAAETED